ncbi:hypothetical protein K1X76_10720 [bacterium]|nr:hypothetical protein [bacterium]
MTCLDSTTLKRYVYEGVITPEEAHHVKTCAHCQISIRQLNEEKKIKGPTRSTPNNQEPSFMHKLLKHRYILIAVCMITAGFLWIVLKLFSNAFSFHFGTKPSMTLLIKSGDEYKPIDNNQSLKVGNNFKVEIKNTEYEYILLMGIDKDGILYEYYPQKTQESLPIPFDTTLILPEIFMFTKNRTQIVLGIFSKSPLEKSLVQNKMREEFLRLQKKHLELTQWKNNIAKSTVLWTFIKETSSQ